MKFETEIPKQTWVTLPKPCRRQTPETEKSKMATRQPFRKWGNWKSIGSYSYTQVLGRWSLELIFKAKVKLESVNQKIQYGRQAAILKVTSLKIYSLLPMTTINMHMKFEIEIPKQTWLMLRKPCRLQTDGRTDGQGESSIPPSNFVGRGYNYFNRKSQRLTFFRSQTHLIRILSQIRAQVVIFEKFFICCQNPLGTFAWQVLSYWLIWKLPNFATEHENSFSSRHWIKILKNKLLLLDNYPTNYAQIAVYCN